MALFLSGLFVGRPIPPSQRSHGDRKISSEDKEPEGTNVEDEADKEALEALKSQYSKMKSKNNAEGRALRAKIKELESK